MPFYLVLGTLASLFALSTGVFSSRETGENRAVHDTMVPPPPSNPGLEMVKSLDTGAGELSHALGIKDADSGRKPSHATIAPPQAPVPGLNLDGNLPDKIDCVMPPGEILSSDDIRKVLGSLGCPTPAERDRLLVQAQHDRFFSNASGGRSNESIHGVSLRGTEQELQIARDILGSRPPKDFVSKASGCSDVKCALTQAFGSEDAALRAMNIHKRFGYAMTVSQHENSPGQEAVWSSDQLKRMEGLLEKLPAAFHRMKSVKAINLITRDSVREAALRHNTTVESFNGLMDFAGKSIIIRDDRNDPYNYVWNQVERTLAHELAHAYDGHHGHDREFHVNSNFDRLSGWRGGKFAEGSCFPSDYAKHDSGEDFAEGVAYYVYGALPMRDGCKEKYDFMKNKVFGGTEYTELGKKNWPELEQALARQGGCQAVVQGCLARLGTPFTSMNDVWFLDQGSNSGGSLENFIGATRCYQDTANELASSLKDTGGFCEFEGAPGIEKHLRAACAAPLWEALSQIKTAIQNPEKSAVASCWAARDFTTECYVRQASLALAQRGVAADSPSRSRDVLEASFKLARGEIDRNASNQLFQSIKPADVAVACLSGLNRISHDVRDGHYYYWTTPNQAISSASSAPGCVAASAQSMRSRGFKIEDTQAEGAVENPATAGIIQDFGTQVVSAYNARLASCAQKSKCTDTLARTLLRDWAQRTEIALSPELEEKLRSLIH